MEGDPQSRAWRPTRRTVADAPHLPEASRQASSRLMPSRISTVGRQPMMRSANTRSSRQAPPDVRRTLPASGSMCSGSNALPASSVTRRTISSVVVGLGPEMLTASAANAAALARDAP